MRELGPMASFHPVKLIEEVKKRPALYVLDKHVDREEKLAQWKEVGAAMYKDWADCNKATAYDRVLQIQRKWRSLRDAYNRELRARRSGVRVNKRVYRYFRKMSFLGGFEGEVEDKRIQWLKACNRPDLYMAYKKNHNILEHKYVCGLHFEKNMVMKRKLRSDAVPTLNLPKSSENCFENIDAHPKLEETKDFGTDTIANQVEIPNKDSGIYFNESDVKIEYQESKEDDDANDDDETELQVCYKESNRNDSIQRTIMISRGVQASLGMDKRGTKNTDPLGTLENSYDSEMTLEQFRKACDKFLNPHLSYYVKTQLVE